MTEGTQNMGQSPAPRTGPAPDDVAPEWVKVVDLAGWRPRDSQGELVHNGRMWVLGGWVGNYKASLRDVWSSVDGENWELAQGTAPWRHGDLPMTLVFAGRMWVMGGWSKGLRAGRCASNEVWWSTDGALWQQATQNAGWTPRLGAGTVAFRDRMWVLGGLEDFFFGDEDSLRNDAWCSVDGKQWELATGNAGWSPRAFHQALVLDDRMWVLGGGNFRPRQHARNDVWCSEDGINWTRATGAAPWAPRLWFSSVTYRDRMWILGGWPEEATPRRPLNLRDVWYSRDGEDWEELKSEGAWTARHAHSTFVFQDKIWVAGGCAGAGPQPLSSEVWSLHVPEEWLEDEP